MTTRIRTNAALLQKGVMLRACHNRWGGVGDGIYSRLREEADARQISLPALLARLATAARMARMEGKHLRKVIK